jgi:flagellar motor switch protein FliM
MFCERVATRLVAEHRTAIEMEVIDVGQFTWINAFAQVPENSLYMTLDTAPHPGRMLLTAELPMVLVALERMLGGHDPSPRDRELTTIDLMVAERLYGTMVGELSQIWFDIAEMTFGIANVDTQGETVQVAAGSEPTLALTLEARLEGISATMTLLVPYAAIAPVASAFSRHEEGGARYDPQAAAAVHRSVSLVDVTLRAEVADTVLTLDDVVALQAGDVVRLDAPADAPVTLYADRTPVHHARAGRSGKYRAVQITTPVTPEP